MAEQNYISTPAPWRGAAPSPPVSAGCRRFLKELFGPNCGDEHLIAYIDKSAQLATRAKPTCQPCELEHIWIAGNRMYTRKLKSASRDHTDRHGGRELNCDAIPDSIALDTFPVASELVK